MLQEYAGLRPAVMGYGGECPAGAVATANGAKERKASDVEAY